MTRPPRLFYMLIMAILVAETSAQYCLRRSKECNPSCRNFLLGGIFLYVMVSLLLLQSYNMEGIGTTNTMWSAFSILAVSGVGWFFLGEKPTRGEVYGIPLIVGGLLAIHIGE